VSAEFKTLTKKSSKKDDTSGDLIEKLVTVNRTSKVVKGGRIFSFSALVVVGDGKGSVGFAIGKAKEAPAAIAKAMENARKNIVKIELNGTTLFHTLHAKYGAAKVIIHPASEGTGLIAGGAMRAVLEVVGCENILAKCLGSTNPGNVVRATVKALESMTSPRKEAHKRNLTKVNFSQEQTND
jgi:small subunit ribosomal protein S5